MKKASPSTRVFQLKVTLKHSDPPIWRRILMPDSATLAELHYVIQTIMPWYDDHLHEFVIGHATYGIPEPDGLFDNDTLEEADYRLCDVLKPATKRFTYVYDFGDTWEHVIAIEKRLTVDETPFHPVCIAGERAAPPEDVGGLWGYYDLLEIQKDPANPHYADMMDWLGEEPVDPDAFDLDAINRQLLYPGRPGRIVSWRTVSRPQKP